MIGFEPNTFVHPSLLLNEYLEPAKNIFEILALTFDDSLNLFKDDRFNQYLFGFRELSRNFYLRSISAKLSALIVLSPYFVYLIESELHF